MQNEKSKNIYEEIKTAFKENLSIFSWQIESEVLSKAELKIESYKLDHNEIILQTTVGMEENLIQMITGMGKLNFYIHESSLLFTSDIKKLEPGGKLTMAFPQTYHFNNRRDGERFEILGLPFFVKLKINGNEIRKSCYDISKGGISILFSQRERVPYKEGDLITNMGLVFGKNEVKFEARVMKVLKLKPYMLENIPYGGTRLSLKFEKMEKLDSVVLEKLTAQLEELFTRKKISS